MPDPPLTPEERGLLAAELALGVLEGADRAEALRLQVMDADFRDAVTAWQKRFEPLLHGYSEVEAPDLWRAIEQRLPVSGDDGEASGAVVGITSRLNAWRAGAILAGAVAAGLAALLLFRPDEAPRPPQGERPGRQSRVSANTPFRSTDPYCREIRRMLVGLAPRRCSFRWFASRI
mgnify:CR=1 FL=1